MIRVQEIHAARNFYEGVLGLKVISEAETISDKTRRLWGLNDRNIRCLRLGKPGDNFGMIDLIEIVDRQCERLRDPQRPWDYGWLTANLKTAHLDRAINAVRAVGAETISTPSSYEAGGKQIREVMINLPSGERCTLLQVGEPSTDAPLFGEPLATMGAVVPSLERSLAFYRDALGLGVALTIDKAGPQFGEMLGAPAVTRLQMALLTSGTNWTGKYEFLQLSIPTDSGVSVQDANARADGYRLGYWMMSVMTQDLDVLQAACRRVGVGIVRGPATIDRPCYGRVRAMIVRAPGGELLECLAPASGKTTQW
jgi:catechol 2,3-dioxygenase-like lactoylglutathione lyase family enzyme